MAFPIEYKSSVLRDLSHLDPSIAEQIVREIEETIGPDPDCGEPLSGCSKECSAIVSGITG
ncbi:MAG TPA: hypothetical protein PLV96_06830 [Methanoregulaceae archaeon]|nr:hypothetical protein [Methanoregulaceae archaeon]HPX74109.1 hypothetical protein [Methanoregulaceae archaeon]HQA80496.1 hypothetical protein [Methanoregulaceae archaeon]